MSFKEWFGNRTHISQLIFILIILYAVSSVNVLVLALGIIPYIPGAYLNPYVLIGFSLVSFALTIFMAAYHLSTMLRRRKRKTDYNDAGSQI